MSDVIDDLGGEEGGEPQIDPATLAEAQEQGWVPQDQWNGKPEEWSDAETFVRRGREINPILRKALKKERERTSALEAELRSTGATVAELREYLSKVEERATKNALASLKKAQRDALEAGDHATAAEYGDQIDELKEAPSAVPKAAATPQAPAQVHPEVAAWMSRNPWFNDDNPEMVEYANGATIALMQAKQRAGITYTPGTLLDEVTVKVKKMFAKQMGGSEPPASMFESGGSSTGSTRATGGKKPAGFDTLPAVARQQFKRFYDSGYYVDIKSGKKLSVAEAQAEYFKEYE
jgi:hypothetical protein